MDDMLWRYLADTGIDIYESYDIHYNRAKSVKKAIGAEINNYPTSWEDMLVWKTN